MDVDAAEAPWLALAEDLNRSDLSPIRGGSAIATRLGRHPSYVAQKLQLLSLPSGVMLLVNRALLSEGHARQLLRVRAIYQDRTREAVHVDPELSPHEAAFVVLREARPEELPPGYLDVVSEYFAQVDEHPEDAQFQTMVTAIMDALATLAGSGTLELWAAVATWWAVVAAGCRWPVAQLDGVIDSWIKRLWAAQAHSLLFPTEPSGDDERAQFDRLSWRAHQADLRYALLGMPAEAAEQQRLLQARAEGFYALPSFLDYITDSSQLQAREVSYRPGCHWHLH